MRKTLFLYLLIGLVVVSCGTPKKAMNDFQYEIASTDKIEGRYYNGIALAENETSLPTNADNLWGMLN